MSPERKDPSKDPRAEAEESPKLQREPRGKPARSGEFAKSSPRSPVVKREEEEEVIEVQRESAPPESAPPRSTDRSKSAREESSTLIGVQTSKATLYVYVAPRSSKKRR